ncbi:MAG: hypothetical protein WB676_03045 [Bryobacteraceae bacterium]
MSTGAVNYEEIPENTRRGTTPISVSQPQGPAFQIKDGEISWQNWHFRFRIDQRVGPVLNLVQFEDGGRLRPILYEASLSELYVPYMDPGNGWNNHVFIDAGEFFSGVGLLQPLRGGLDCPANAAYFDALPASGHGAPHFLSQMVCPFERTASDPAWRHYEGHEVYGRPSRELVLRSAAAIGNYDYLMDWRFSRTERFYGGPPGRTKPAIGPMRKSIWVVKPSIATCERDAMLDIHLERPTMWLFINPNVRGPLGYPTGYEIMPGATATSLMSSDDLPQKLGGFSEHQFWVTPYSANERYAAGLYPTSSKATDGLPFWTKANRPIENTDIVGWYTLGFHHMPRVEDWPVMPTMWHEFQIRPFNFFSSNPALDLPKSP